MSTSETGGGEGIDEIWIFSHLEENESDFCYIEWLKKCVFSPDWTHNGVIMVGWSSLMCRLRRQ